MLSCFILPLLIFAFSHPGAAQIAAPATESGEITSRPIRSFRIGSGETQFGPLEFAGGLEITSPAYRLGALSSFRFLKPGSHMVGVTDTGMWFFGNLVRDEAFRPLAFTDFTTQPIHDDNPGDGKWSSDAESIAVKGNKAIVGFEYTHRIVEFEIGNVEAGAPLADVDPLIPREEMRSNQGFETLAFAPQDSEFRGALTVVSERSLDAAGNILAAVLDGPRKGIFSVKRDASYDITDGAFLPDGDLLLLERQFTIATGTSMRLRRIIARSIVPGGLADGPVLLEADRNYQIDNMEGLDIWRAPDGTLMVSLISDDNQSMFQRNLYLEFRYAGE